MFRPGARVHRKPDGIYLIPTFSGATESGHWYAIILEKRGRNKKGFIIDSLGTGNTNNSIIRKITDAFNPGRGTCEWYAPQSIRQQGVECGPRTVCTLETICEGRKNEDTIEISVENATLRNDETDSSYDQMKYRRKAANLIGRHRRQMQTQPRRNRLTREK